MLRDGCTRTCVLLHGRVWCGGGECANWSVEILLVLNENKFFYKYDERNIRIEYVKGKKTIVWFGCWGPGEEKLDHVVLYQAKATCVAYLKASNLMGVLNQPQQALLIHSSILQKRKTKWKKYKRRVNLKWSAKS